MNKIILGATFVAIAALVGSPILAEAIEELRVVKVTTDGDGNFEGIVFKTFVVIPMEGTVSGGYAIPTEDGDFIAVTSHAGIADSISQNDANDPIWHSHLVQASENDSCADLAIDAISFEEPAAMVLVKENSNSIFVRTVAYGDITYFDEIGQTDLVFTVGNPIDLEPVKPNLPEVDGLVESIAFDLNVAEDDTICIGEAEAPNRVYAPKGSLTSSQD